MGMALENMTSQIQNLAMAVCIQLKLIPSKRHESIFFFIPAKDCSSWRSWYILLIVEQELLVSLIENEKFLFLVCLASKRESGKNVHWRRTDNME